MNITVRQDSFAKALGNVTRVAQAKGGLDILNNVLLRTENNQLVIAGTNLEVAAVQRIGAKIQTHGSITVPAKLINELISNFPKTTISLEVKNTIVTFKADNNTATLNGMADEEFPELPVVDEKNGLSYSLAASDIKQALTQTILTASNDSTRPVLTGVYWHSFEKQLYFAATDGYRLSERRLIDVETDIAAIIPTVSLQEVLRSLTEDIEEITVLFDETQVTFKVGDGEITSRLIDGNFPDYRQLIPNETGTNVTLSTQELQRIVKLTSLYTRGTGGSIVIDVDTDAESVSIRSTASEYGENQSTLTAKCSGESGSITLNARYVSDALGVLSSPEIEIGFDGKLSPCVFMPVSKDEENYKHIVMPIKS